jgi:hypothetical protein
MQFHPVWILALLVFASNAARAQEPCTERIQGLVPEGDETHFFIDFEVPEGTAEIEVRHDDLSSANILDWGLDDPNGFRGWGGGKSEPAIVNLQAASPSYVPGPIIPGGWEVVVGKAQIEETPAEYDVCIILRTETTLEPQPRSPYQDPGALNTEARWYAGDLHIHTVQSDGRPTMREALEFADSIGLDFVMLSEHNTNSGLTLYGELQPDFPTLLMIPGFEWTSYSGHAHAIGATEWVDQKIGVRGVTMEGAIQGIQEQGAIFSIDHPTVPGGNFCIGCPWDIPVDPTLVEGVEVQGGIWDACAEGSRATALGGSDDHEGGQGSGVLYSPMGMPTTMVYAEELSVAGILEGVRSGRVVIKVNSSDDPMLETELSGERVQNTVFADSATLSVRVTGGTGNTLQVWKNGAVVESMPVDSDPFDYEMAVEAPAEGEDRYRHQIVDVALEPTTIGSYVWLRAAEGTDNGESSSGCSCRTVTVSERDTFSLLMVLGFGALLWRRRSA